MELKIFIFSLARLLPGAETQGAAGSAMQAEGSPSGQSWVLLSHSVLWVSYITCLSLITCNMGLLRVSTSLGVLRGVNELIHVKCLAQCMTESKHYYYYFFFPSSSSILISFPLKSELEESSST